MASDSEEIEAIRREEIKKVGILDPEKIRESRQRIEGYKTFLRSLNRKQFEQAILKCGVRPDTEEYQELLEIWYQYKQDHLPKQKKRPR